MRIVLAGGFTGTKKENAIISIANELNSRNNKVAILITEHLSDDTKSSVIADSEITVKERISSCVSCSFIFDLISEVQEISKKDAFDIIVIELPFNSMPAEIKEGLVNFKFPYLTFSPIINVFDMENLQSDSAMIPRVVSNQIMESEIIFVNTDSTIPEKAVAVREMLEIMNPKLKVFELSTGSKGHELSDFIDLIIR